MLTPKTEISAEKLKSAVVLDAPVDNWWDCPAIEAITITSSATLTPTQKKHYLSVIGSNLPKKIPVYFVISTNRIVTFGDIALGLSFKPYIATRNVFLDTVIDCFYDWLESIQNELHESIKSNSTSKKYNAIYANNQNIPTNVGID